MHPVWSVRTCATEEKRHQTFHFSICACTRGVWNACDGGPPVAVLCGCAGPLLFSDLEQPSFINSTHHRRETRSQVQSSTQSNAHIGAPGRAPRRDRLQTLLSGHTVSEKGPAATTHSCWAPRQLLVDTTTRRPHRLTAEAMAISRDRTPAANITYPRSRTSHSARKRVSPMPIAETCGYDWSWGLMFAASCRH